MSNQFTPPEIQFLAGFLIDLLQPNSQDQNQNHTAKLTLAERISSRFIPHHWYPCQPERGSGYRAISFDPTRQDGYLDPILSILTLTLGISYRQVRRLLVGQNYCSNNMVFSSGWMIWCDPGCVSLRLQASGGELRELWGHLPDNLSLRNNSSPTPIPTSITHSSSSSPCTQLSSNKSRAIPILAPSSALRLAGVTGLAVTPATPSSNGHSPSSSLKDVIPQDHDQQHQTLVNDSLNVLFDRSSPPCMDDDPFMRPSSRTSCASSSSDGSDQSRFSTSSSSTATSVAPTGHPISKKPLGHQPLQQVLIPPQLHSGFIRHHSTSSLPYVSIRSITPGALIPNPQPQAPVLRAVSLSNPNHRRRHTPSASVSSLGSGRGLLVLKEGPGTVTEHSGGKVGVMGGGVLLGIPKDKDSSGVITSNTARRIVSRRSRSGAGNV